MKPNIFVTGFSGTGKTTVGRRVANLLGWGYVDTDDEIASQANKSIAEIFEQEGETVFRQLETATLSRLCKQENQVVSTGGGITIDLANRSLMDENGMVICLEAKPQTIHSRLSSELTSSDGAHVRPMLKSSDHLLRIETLKAKRQESYAMADWIIQTDQLSSEEVAFEIIRAWETLSRRTSVKDTEKELVSVVNTSSVSYPIWVGWDLIDRIGGKIADDLEANSAYLVTDEGAYLHARRAQASLENARIASHIFVIPRGESSKNLEMATRIYKWLASLRAERGHLIIAIGGGVVGDLAGFVAATYLRGMPFVQVPTTMLAMMDAAIGGKTAVDLTEGKNLVGAFHQPKLVLADVNTLTSLPDRELNSGWAEAIKHGLILDADLFQDFEVEGNALRSLERDISIDIIQRSIAIKAKVVTSDEKETLGLRILLNYGHTVGHAIETVTAYSQYLHGEAVSIGMMVAARISESMGILSAEEVLRQQRVLEAFQLPISLSDFDMDSLKNAMKLDKKTVEGSIRWVLLDGIGHAVTRENVPENMIDQALDSLDKESDTRA